MPVRKNSYITTELDFAEEQLATWRAYIEANPVNEIKDRWGVKELPKGGMARMVTATAEQQIKCVQDTMARYLQMLEVVENLREKQAVKQNSVRGSQGLSPFEDGTL